MKKNNSIKEIVVRILSDRKVQLPLVLALLLQLFCADLPVNPYNIDNTNISLLLRSKTGLESNSILYDTVGNEIQCNMMLTYPKFIKSIRLQIITLTDTTEFDTFIVPITTKQIDTICKLKCFAIPGEKKVLVTATKEDGTLITSSVRITILYRAVVDGTSIDHQFDDRINNFGCYWYYYDDNRGATPNDRPQAAPSTKPSVINVPYTLIERHAFGDISDKYIIKNYTFVTSSDSGNNHASIPFTYGSTWYATHWTATPYVGIGTQLAIEGSSLDLTGVTKILFRIRSNTGPLNIRFLIRTKDIDDFSNLPVAQLKGDEFGYYGKNLDITTAWSTDTMLISELTLPGSWARNVPFDIKKCTAIHWEIAEANNLSTISDMVEIDDVTILKK